MSGQTQRQIPWHRLPVVGFLVSEWLLWRDEQRRPPHRLANIPDRAPELLPYPLDMWSLLALPHGTVDEAGVPYNAATGKYPATYHPTTIAQYALAHWNAYLTTKEGKHRQAFTIQARWLVEHESRRAGNVGVWPIPFATPDYYAWESWLSALTHGNIISVLVRAYKLTHEDIFLEVAHRAVRTFELDIRDGGVSACIGDNGVFFEEVAVYPAAHILNGYVFALFGLYDFVALTGDTQIKELIQRSLGTLHTLIDRFDTGYWSRYDLLFKHLAPLFYHALHITMLEVIAQYSGCEHCAALAAQWAAYRDSLRCRLCYFSMSRIARYRRGLRRALSRLFRAGRQIAPRQTSIPITAPSSSLRRNDREVHS